MSSRNGPVWRLGSPPGGSILTTSAPRSPRSLPQYCPFSSASSSTLRPESGPGDNWASVTATCPPYRESADDLVARKYRQQIPHEAPRGCSPIDLRRFLVCAVRSLDSSGDL